MQDGLARIAKMQIAESEKFLVFLCSGAAKSGNKKLSCRIALRLVAMGLAEIGDLQNLSQQHGSSIEEQRRMIFINDCRSGCVNVFTHGFDKSMYVYLDVSANNGIEAFDVDQYVHSEVLQKINSKWHSLLPRLYY